MKVLFIMLIIYLVISLLLSLIGIIFNGAFDQSKESLLDVVGRAFKWPIGLLKIIFGR